MLSAGDGALPAGLALVLARPLGALAFLLPLILLLATLRRARPEVRVTGTVALWQQGPGPSGRRRARRPPLAVWLAAAALALGALALSGPRAARAARTWTVVVDTRPSLGLAPESEGSGGSEERGSRADQGMRRASEIVAARAHRGDRVRWVQLGDPQELWLAPGETPPSAWWSARALGRESRFERHDAPGATIVTDLPPDPPLERAGWVATGASPTPGPIGADGADLLVWDGRELRREPGAAAKRSVVLERGAGGAELPAVLERVIDAWSEARGIERALEGSPRTALVLELAGDAGRAVELVTGRDGWSAACAASALGALENSEPRECWLAGSASAGESPCIVDAGAGRVRTSLVRLDEPAGDPAAFAVSWAELLDGACLPPAGAVALEERRREGPRLERAPLAPEPDQAERASGAVDAWLAGGSALLAAAAVAAARSLAARAAHPQSAWPTSTLP